MISATPPPTDEEMAAITAAVAALRRQTYRAHVRMPAWRRAMRSESVEPFQR